LPDAARASFISAVASLPGILLAFTSNWTVANAICRPAETRPGS
jgi:hypothetical protein